MTSDRLRNVRWIGGGSGAGKSTVAGLLADRYGLRVHRPEPPSQHLARSTPESAPLLHSFAAMSMDERWANRSPQVMMDTFHAFQGECFDLVLEDLCALPEQPHVLVEGFNLLPRLVAPLLESPERAVRLLPTPAFRRAAFERRGSTWTIAGKTSMPERALDNLLERDRLFTDQLRHEAADLRLQTIEVDGRQEVEQVTETVARLLGLPDDG